MNEEKDFSEVINSVFSSIGAVKSNNAISMHNEWRKIMLRIKSNTNPYEGQNLADHTRVLDLKNGVLFIESDHPGWTSLIQMHRKFILNGIKMDMPELEVNSIAIRLKGNDDSLSEYGAESYSVQRMREIIEKRAKKEQKEIEEAYSPKKKTKKQSKELPPEIAAVFDDIIKSKPCQVFLIFLPPIFVNSLCLYFLL